SDRSAGKHKQFVVLKRGRVEPAARGTHEQRLVARCDDGPMPTTLILPCLKFIEAWWAAVTNIVEASAEIRMPHDLARCGLNGASLLAASLEVTALAFGVALHRSPSAQTAGAGLVTVRDDLGGCSRALRFCCALLRRPTRYRETARGLEASQASR